MMAMKREKAKLILVVHIPAVKKEQRIRRRCETCLYTLRKLNTTVNPNRLGQRKADTQRPTVGLLESWTSLWATSRGAKFA